MLLLATVGVFALLVIPQAAAVKAYAGPEWTRLLDEYVMTSTPQDARGFLEALGPNGREAYRQFYLHLDFWIPELVTSLFYISLMSLAFPATSRFAWLNVAPIALWLVDIAENLNHFTMATLYPNLSNFSLT